ncbi:ABC transporter permease [Allokutzneria albata]|uniref:Monosaccharide ABC transporter membrane protein, CUT2 family n=1 Tax=Allokutzneria albata TaxID=211114 RepID=A0A1G9QZW3_ALLAB|nr:ABC transporter permease [Allokutzneria albata]SDM16410.1 monosaccharide ABC transporter membrane protein, CUT2 family [Allokutzneria albata]
MSEVTAGIRPGSRAHVVGLARDYGVYVALGLLVVVNLVITPNFLSVDNLRTQAVQVVPVLVVALGMALVIGTKGVDLSVGSVMALATAMLPMYLGYGPVVAVVICLAVGAAAGLLNGSLVAFIGVQPIVATLALLVGGRGLALVISGGQLREVRNPEIRELGAGSVLGVPYTVLVAVVLVVLVSLLVGRTTFGRQLVAVGGNPKAAEFAGLPVKRVLLGVYVLCAVLAAIAGVLATARLTASDPSRLGELIELSAITAVVVGGTPLSGGRVRVLGTVAGAVLMQLITATLIKNDVPASVAQMAQALIIVAAVLVQRERNAS